MVAGIEPDQAQRIQRVRVVGLLRQDFLKKGGGAGDFALRLELNGLDQLVMGVGMNSVAIQYIATSAINTGARGQFCLNTTPACS